MRVKKESVAVLVVDYQEKIVPVMNGTKELIQKASILLQGMRILEIPMYITQQYTKGLGETVKEITDAVGTTDYIEKLRFSSFTDVEKEIKEKEFVIVCGIEAHICVLQTVIELAEHGYKPVLVTDCISSRKEKDYEIALKRAEKEGAILTTYEAILFELLAEAGTEKSKKIQKLIR